MLAKRFRRLVWFCGLAAALAGCEWPVNALVALGEPGEASFDPRLIGAWYMYDDGDPPGVVHHLSIRGADGGQSLDAVVFVLEHKRPTTRTTTTETTTTTTTLYGHEDKVAWFRASAFPSEIGGKTYFNVFNLTCSKDSKDKNCLDGNERLGYMIFRVEVSEDDKLRLCALNRINETKLSSAGRELWRKAVENGQIREVTIERHDSYFQLDLSRDDLRADPRS